MFEVHPNAPALRSVHAVMASVDEDAQGVETVPTGFQPLDTVLEGGLRPRDLNIIGGAPGQGKTVMAMQWARNAASQGRTVVYACYDHDHLTLLSRLLLLEVGDLVEGSPGASGPTRSSIRDIAMGEASLEEELNNNLLLRAAYTRVQDYGDRLWFIHASRSDTDLEALAESASHAGPGNLVIVDFLQKVPHAETDELSRVASIAQGLKEIALESHVAVLAIVASDASGLNIRRLRMHHLNGASGIGYEADLLMLLNGKFTAVSKLHSSFDLLKMEEHKRKTVLSFEKYRHGPDAVDLEFVKDFAHYRFQPGGGHVEEALIDEVMFPE